jgi:hypothetical protein
VPLDPQFRAILDTFESKGPLPLVRGDAAETSCGLPNCPTPRSVDRITGGIG